jgi:predicted transcriptional regulator
MANDLLTSYKYGWKTSYYQNTYDFKGEEEDLQPAGIETTQSTEGEDVELEGITTVNGHDKDAANTDDPEHCDACAI